MIGVLAVFLGGCASAPEPGFKPVASFREVATGGCELEFRKEEIWRPHGLFTFPRVAEISTYMILPMRAGNFPVSGISLRGAGDTNLLRSRKSFRGHIDVSDEKVIVDIHELGDDGIWRPLELNGTYRIIRK
jgi:hypothetical protein